MKALIQRALSASVTVEDQIIGSINHGLVLLIGIEKHDTPSSLEKMADKVVAYRLFADGEGKMNLNVNQVGGGLLAISQFTLAANTNKGLRPSFSAAAAPSEALTLFDEFVALLKQRTNQVETGVFGADMKVQLINDGPVTFMLEN